MPSRSSTALTHPPPSSPTPTVASATAVANSSNSLLWLSDNPRLASSVCLLDSGNLLLLSPGGFCMEITFTFSTVVIDAATTLKTIFSIDGLATGIFDLIGGVTVPVPVWQSFDHPAPGRYPSSLASSTPMPASLVSSPSGMPPSPFAASSGSPITPPRSPAALTRPPPSSPIATAALPLPTPPAPSSGSPTTPDFINLSTHLIDIDSIACASIFFRCIFLLFFHP
uniref:Formin-like protein 13 n=1 Tax=Elaeis guineensis var. tenera TaxID=51953 RepID=A0A6I9R707_ELAGV|nr:formin-like protein 13 [Elaeis guineensis]